MKADPTKEKAREELREVRKKIELLNAQKEILVRLLGDDVNADDDAKPSRASRPKDKESTRSILEDIRANPGRTIPQTAKAITGQDDGDEFKKVYNALYGLVRRGRVVRDVTTGGLSVAA